MTKTLFLRRLLVWATPLGVSSDVRLRFKDINLHERHLQQTHMFAARCPFAALPISDEACHSPGQLLKRSKAWAHLLLETRVTWSDSQLRFSSDLGQAFQE